MSLNVSIRRVRRTCWSVVGSLAIGLGGCSTSEVAQSTLEEGDGVRGATLALQAAGAPGTWTPLTQPLPAPISHTLLLMDGTVLAQEYAGGNGGIRWWRLKPDSAGSYVNGTWSAAASANYPRWAYASAVLRDGRVFVAGGEYGAGAVSTVEIYDPRRDTWTNVPGYDPYLYRSDIADSTAITLADGRALLFPRLGVAPATYEPCTGAWHRSSSGLYGVHDEESVAKLPDGSYLMASDIAPLASQRFVPTLDRWFDAGTLPAAIVDSEHEVGPAVLLYDGRVLALGATSHNAFYLPPATLSESGSWQAAPDFPAGMNASDVPAAVMGNGHVLIAVNSTGPTAMLEYRPESNSFVSVPVPLSHPTASPATNMLVLPTGDVLMTDGGSSAAVYTPTSAPNANWRPKISSIVSRGDGSYLISGSGLNGLTEGAYFGDDAQSASNYPLVRLTDGAGVVRYGTTYAGSTMGLGSSAGSTSFVLPGVPTGNYTLEVVTNGIASDPFSLSVTDAVAQCNNGVRDGDETGLDCGGGCVPCVQSCAFGSAAVQPNAWTTSSDLSGDRVDDIVTSGLNRVRIHLGGARIDEKQVVLRAPAAGETQFGATTRTLGDVNGDGVSDLGVSALTASGPVVHVYFGAFGGPAAAPNQTLSAPDPSGNFGLGMQGAGDINGDGFADLLVSDDAAQASTSASGVVYIYLGSASGLATTPVTINSPRPNILGFGLAGGPVGDLNGDGNSDLVLGSRSDQAFVYLGSRTAQGVTYSAALPTGAGPTSFGDVNGDGFADFVLAGQLYSGQSAAPGFGSSTPDIPAPSAGARLADLDADGFADLVSVTDDGQGHGVPSVFRGSLAGLSTTATLRLTDPGGGFSPTLAVGDYTGDGWLDVAVWSANGRRVYTFAGARSGLSTTLAEEPFAVGSSKRLEPDFNGDNLADVVQVAGAKVRILLGKETKFVQSPAKTLRAPSAGETRFTSTTANIGDVNGDGISDLAVAGTVGSLNQVHLYYGAALGPAITPSRTLAAENPYSGYGYAIVGAGDVNGDGYGDLLVSDVVYGCDDSGCAGVVYLYYGSASGVIDSPTRITRAGAEGGFGWVVAALGDVNSDGFDDFAAGGGSTGIGLYLGATGGPVSSTVLADTASTANPFAAVGDFNGDDASDIVLGRSVYLGQPTSPYLLASSATLPATGELRTQDLNDDGFDDVLAVRIDKAGLDLYAGTAAGLATTALPLATFPTSGLSASFATVGHLGSRQWLDVAVWSGNQASSVARLLVYRGARGALASSPIQNTAPNVPSNFNPDFNGDGYGDLYVRSGGGPVQLYYGAAAGFGSTPSVTLPVLDGNASFGSVVSHLGDLNRDGFTDFGVSSYSSLYVYLGAASGLSRAASFSYASTTRLFALNLSAAGDLSGDGYDDVLTNDQGVGCGESWCQGAVEVYFGSQSGQGKLAWSYGTGDQVNFGAPVVPVGDVENDGRTDFVLQTGTMSGPSASFLYHVTTDQYFSTTSSPVAGVPSTAGDLNGDGFSDLVIGSTVYYGPDVSTSSVSTRAIPANTGAVAADFNTDGVGDLLLAQGNQVRFYAGPGLGPNPGWAVTMPNGATPTFAEVSDFNQDGRLDASLIAGDRLYIYRGAAAGFGATPAQTYVLQNGGLVPGQ